MKKILRATVRSVSFTLWSLRRRTGQIVPVGIAFLLLVGATQTIGTLHDISSVLTQQQIARSWRSSYDLLIRPQSAISQPEQSAGWIDPQNAFEHYGGINDRQLAAIRSLAHVTELAPFAMVGWQHVTMLIPVTLSTKGIYRILARWNGTGSKDSPVVYYVDVSDFAHLLTEKPLSSPIVQHVLMNDVNGVKPAIFTLPVPMLQAIMGLSAAQRAAVQRMLFEGSPSSASALSLSISIERLQGGLSNLPKCVTYINCWHTIQARQGTPTYRADGVQLLRYSATRYSATAQQIADGQVSVEPNGEDTQGPIYRVQLPVSQNGSGNVLQNIVQQSLSLLPFSGPLRLPFLSATAHAVHEIPLEQACAINGPNCYSGMYVRMNGVEQYNQNSLHLLQATASAISARTGLHVDILDGSSVRIVSLIVPHAQPVISQWRVVGVAVQIVHGVDTLQEILLILCSLVCLLSIGSAGVLVGIGRRKDALLLRQIGWSPYLSMTVFTLDALFLCLAGCLVAGGWMVLSTWRWTNSLPSFVLWGLLIAGIFIYIFALVPAACSSFSKREKVERKKSYLQWEYLQFSSGGGRSRDIHGAKGWGHILPGMRTLFGELPLPRRGLVIINAVTTSISPRLPYLLYKKRLTQSLPTMICSLAILCSVFLIAAEYLMVMSLNQVLVVTVLGNQVREALEGSQIALLIVVVCAALLTVGLCTKLLLQGRRKEFALLAMVGWEERTLFWRILWDSWRPAMISGEIGGVLAIGILALLNTLPSPLVLISVLIWGPLIGIVLASMPTTGFAFQETKRVFIWR